MATSAARAHWTSVQYGWACRQQRMSKFNEFVRTSTEQIATGDETLHEFLVFFRHTVVQVWNGNSAEREDARKKFKERRPTRETAHCMYWQKHLRPCPNFTLIFDV